MKFGVKFVLLTLCCLLCNFSLERISALEMAQITDNLMKERLSQVIFMG